MNALAANIQTDKPARYRGRSVEKGTSSNTQTRGHVIRVQAMADLTREELDAKLERTEARVHSSVSHVDAALEKISSEFKILSSEIKGDLAGVSVELSHKPSSTFFLFTVGASFAGTLAFLTGILAFGGDRFDGGVQLSMTSLEQVVESRKLADENREKIDTLTAAVQNLINEIKESRKEPDGSN